MPLPACVSVHSRLCIALRTCSVGSTKGLSSLMACDTEVCFLAATLVSFGTAGGTAQRPGWRCAAAMGAAQSEVQVCRDPVMHSLTLLSWF